MRRNNKNSHADEIQKRATAAEEKRERSFSFILIIALWLTRENFHFPFLLLFSHIRYHRRAQRERAEMQRGTRVRVEIGKQSDAMKRTRFVIPFNGCNHIKARTRTSERKRRRRSPELRHRVRLLAKQCIRFQPFAATKPFHHQIAFHDCFDDAQLANRHLATPERIKTNALLSLYR